jgi:hypothetical protein
MDTNGTPRRFRHRTLLLLLTVALLNVPAIAVATHIFSDVPDGSTHAAGIHWLADAGITTGCTPTTYCPGDSLTRAQMGSFLFRASGNAPGIAASSNARSVSAGAIQTVQSSNTVTGASSNSHTVACPTGTSVVGGGGFTSSTQWRLEDSRPVGASNWQVLYRHQSGTGDQTTTVYARCLRIGQ